VTVVFEPYKAYDGSEIELSSLMKIKKEEVKNYIGNFSFEILEITRYVEAEVNQDLFDKIFGEGNVKTDEEFRQKTKEDILFQTTPDSDYIFLLDARKLLQKKTAKLEFPETFLKRWLQASDQKYTPETIEKDYPKIIEDLKYHLYKEYLAKENAIKVEDGDIMEYAKRTVKMQFAQIGATNFPEYAIEGYAKDILKNEETVQSIINKILDDKLIGWMKEHITLETKEVSGDEFRKMLE